MRTNKSTVSFSETDSKSKIYSIPKSSSDKYLTDKYYGGNGAVIIKPTPKIVLLRSNSNDNINNNSNNNKNFKTIDKNKHYKTSTQSTNVINYHHNNNKMNSLSLPSPLLQQQQHQQQQQQQQISCSTTTNSQSPNQLTYESDRLNIINSSNNNSNSNNLNQPLSKKSTSAIVSDRNPSISSTTVEELQISRRPSVILQDLLSTRRPSAIMAALRPNFSQNRPRVMSMVHEDPLNGSLKSLNTTTAGSGNIANGPNCEMAIRSKRKNRRIGDDALSTALSALYCKLIVILGVAMPVTEIISSKIPAQFYQGFYVYLYLVSITFVIFVYLAHMKSRALFNIIKTYHEKTSNVHIKRKTDRFGSFYLRVGAIAFGIGTMVYSGLEFGQYFELHGLPGCKNFFVALTPAARMALAIFQMQFIFLNTTELDMGRHKVITRFGLMHMVATNLCEWLYVLVEETKHEIYHIMHSKIDHKNQNSNFKNTNSHTVNDNELYNNITDFQNISTIINQNVSNTGQEFHSNSEHYINCQRTNIMGSLVQDASPFLFPCTIEYSLICAVILYEMWKKVKSIPDIAKSRHETQKANQRMAHHFSVDCSRAHRGMFVGIMIIVLTIICMIMYFVLHVEPGYELLAMQEVTICETVMYSLTSIAVIAAMIRMRDLKFLNKRNIKHSSSISLDCTLLVLAQTGTYVYGMFSIMGSYFSIAEGTFGGTEALIAEVIGLFQTSIQTLFILNASWRRCKGAQQQRIKPGRELVTFLLVANICMWFINTLIKGRAAFRNSHLEFFGIWAWTIITHVSMPLAIFYRFHSTICLFEIWKSSYKIKSDH